MPRTLVRVLPLVCALLVFALGCGPGHPNRIVVGSKNFTENVLLAELMAQQIESDTGLEVDRRFNLGGTFLCHEALAAGQIDLYPEYTGTAWTAILKRPVLRDAARVLAELDEAYRGQYQLQWGQPFGFNNTFVLVLRKDAAAGEQWRGISDLIPAAPNLTIGFGFEFLDREDGYRGLVETYGLAFRGEPVTMDLNLVYEALRSHRIDVGVGNSTDGLIAMFDLTVLEDDRRYFPPYDAAPVVRSVTVESHPEVKAALDRLGGVLGDGEMRRINQQISGDRRPIEDVARELRLAKGL
jgi:osmoprotectant transport system substrate-binding protein